MTPFKNIEYEDKKLKIRYEPYLTAFGTYRDYLTLIEEIENGGPLP
jgi:hypothetical protein